MFDNATESITRLFEANSLLWAKLCVIYLDYYPADSLRQ